MANATCNTNTICDRLSLHASLEKGESNMKPIFLFPILLSIAWLSASAEEPPIEIRVVAAQLNGRSTSERHTCSRSPIGVPSE